MNKEEIESLFKKYKVKIPKEKQGQSECYECKRNNKYSLTWTSFLYEYKENYYCFEHIVNILLQQENQELKKQLEVGEQQYNDLVEEKEKLDAENQVLKDYKNVALTYMKNYLKMELNYRNKDVAEHFKVVIDMLNRGNKHGNLVDIIDCDTQQKEFIEYLTSYIYLLSNKPDLIEENQKDILEEILSKYREIIGGKDE